MKKYVCPCGYVYDPEMGDPDSGIALAQRGKMFPKIGSVPYADWVKTHLKKNN